MEVICNFCLWRGPVDLGTEICPFCKEIGHLLPYNGQENELPEEIEEDCIGLPEDCGLDNVDSDVDVPQCNEMEY